MLSAIIGVLPFIFFKEQENVIFKVLWIIIVAFFVCFSIFIIFHYRQYLYVKNSKLILKNSFSKIKELNINDCYYEVTRLQSYFSRKYIFDNWICIYSLDEMNKFKCGFSNGKKFKGIQLTYNESTLEFVNTYVKKK